MGLQRAERPSFTFNKGLNTDAPALVYPADFTLDEENFEILLDGTRRRRRGLESVNVITDSEPEDATVQTFKWRAVGGDPSVNWHVLRVGDTLYFYDDIPNLDDAVMSFVVNLGSFLVSDDYATDMATAQIDLSFGRGDAVLVGQYINPTLLHFNPEDFIIESTTIDIRERDFQGVDDGLDNQTEPGELSDPALYNLLNQGWKYGNISTYFASKAKYPAKNMLQWLAYRRATIAGYDPADGTRQFSPDKLEAELFQDAPAPRGHFIQNPFNTSALIQVDDTTQKNYIADWEFPVGSLNLPYYHSASVTQTLILVRFQYPHGLEVGETFKLYTEVHGKRGTLTGDGDGGWSIGMYNNQGDPNYVVEEVPAPDHVRFYLRTYDDHAGWRPHGGAYYPKVVTYSTGATVDLAGTITDERPTTSVFAFGRAWYAGIKEQRMLGNVYVSQVIEVEEQYGKCYQAADPTDENISDLLPTDGFVLRIPEAGLIHKLVFFFGSVLVFASNGIWQIGAGSDGFVTTTSYVVRKLSDIGTVNAASIVNAEGTPLYWGQTGIFAIVQDANTGYLVVQSVSQGKIDNLYSTIGMESRRTATSDFDGVAKRVVWVYYDFTEAVHRAIIYDARYGAFTKWSFSAPVYDIFTTTDVTPGWDSALRFIVLDSETLQYSICSTTSLDFTDMGASFDSYMVAGYDTAESPVRNKTAAYVTVFSKRTELVRSPGDADLEVYNEGGLMMYARWDWADGTISGKWGTGQQIYRHNRLFMLDQNQSEGPLDNGLPIVVTRNKVRGKGRALNLYFESETGKDAHLLGWHTNFNVMTDV